MSQLLQELLIISQLSESTGTDLAALKNSKEYQELEKHDQKFAKNLLISWESDAYEYAKTKGKNKELLFPLNFKADNLKLKSPAIGKLNNLQSLENGLLKLYHQTFPHISSTVKVDNSVWQHEKWTKEALFTKAEHDMLREELTNGTSC
jgi:hypothetical protein